MEINNFFSIDLFKTTASTPSRKKKTADETRESKSKTITDNVTISDNSLGKIQQKAATATISDAETAKKELDKVKEVLLEQGTKTMMAQSHPLPQSVYDFFGVE